MLAVSYQNAVTVGNTPAPSHVYLATSIDSGLTWTYTHTKLDGGGGAAKVPQTVGSIIATRPSAVTAWYDFRPIPPATTQTINGDIYAAVAH